MHARLLRGEIAKQNCATEVIRLRSRYRCSHPDPPVDLLSEPHGTRYDGIRTPAQGRTARRVRKEVHVLTVYGADSCEDTQRALRQLRRLAIPHAYLNVDKDASALDRAKALNHGKRRTPVIQLDDGEVLVEPSNRTLIEAATRNGLLDESAIAGGVRRQNVGDLERAIRISGGLAAAALGLKAPKALRVALLLFGGWEVVTGVLGWCPAFSVCGVSSLGGPLDHPLEADRDTWLVKERQDETVPG